MGGTKTTQRQKAEPGRAPLPAPIDVTDTLEGSIDGVRILRAKTFKDHRGNLTEFYRQEWFDKEPAAIQWDVVRTSAGVLRGVHVHLHRYDYIIVPEGRVLVGMHDLRLGSPTEGNAMTVEVTNDPLDILVIPPGIAHGYYALKDLFLLYGLSYYFDGTDEVGMHYADPELGMRWPDAEPTMSDIDKGLPPVSQVRPRIPRYEELQP